MPKGQYLRDALQTLREYAASLAPQKGMFSTLDELIQEAPFERAPADQWRGYLKPGRMLKRGEAQFPLKQEEMDWALKNMPDWGGTIDKDKLLDFTRRNRPRFKLTIGDDKLSGKALEQYSAQGRPQMVTERLAHLYDTEQPRGSRRFNATQAQYGPSQYDNFEDTRLAHVSPGSEYQESITGMSGLSAPHGQHFGHDVVSHSRTSSHDVPNLGRVRLVEEIQSDLHERAAEKVHGAWPNWLDPEDKAEYDAISRRQEALSTMGENYVSDPEMIELSERYAELQRIGEARRPRRGYMTRDEQRELDQLDAVHATLTEEAAYPSADPEGRLSGFDEQWSREMRDRRDELRDKVGVSVSEAPFKGPKDYGRLELRKQMLTAANEGEDFLALTRGQDQAERYGMEDHEVTTRPSDQARGMKYVYDDLYRSELEKLARQYGTVVKDVEIPVGSIKDWRPQYMLENELERPEDIQDLLNGTFMPDDDPGFIMDTINDETDTTLMHLAEMLEQVGAPSDDTRKALRNMKEIASKYSYIEEEGGLPGSKLSKISEEDMQKWDSTTGWIASQVANYQARAPKSTQRTKSFPAMVLTPEVRERIKNIGTPLFSVFGAAAFQDDPDEQEEVEEPQGFAKGGMVRSAMRTLKEVLSDIIDQADNPRSMTRRLKKISQLAEENPDLRVKWGSDGVEIHDPKSESDFPVAYLEVYPREKKPYPHYADVDTTLEGQGLGSLMYLEAARRLKLRGKSLHKSNITSPDADALWRRLPKGTDPEMDPVPRMNDESIYVEDPEPTETVLKYEEGGRVSEEDDHQLINRALTALREQWSAINPDTGEPEMILPHNLTERNKLIPGIVNDTLGIPYDMLGLDMGFSRDASNASADLHARMMARAGLDEPEGVLEHGADAAGMMAGQIPTGLAGATKKLGKTLVEHMGEWGREPLRKMIRTMRSAPSSAVEFMSPVVEPRLGNYAAGAGFGAALGIPDELRGDGRSAEGVLSEDELEEIRQHLAMLQEQDDAE